MLGGHGYSSYSKLGTLYNDHDVNNTWEGDNNVLIQQATKYILDNVQKAVKGQNVNSNLLNFLKNVL
jgi:acyl-CoA oxidase